MRHLLFGEPGIQRRMLGSIDRLNTAGETKATEDLQIIASASDRVTFLSCSWEPQATSMGLKVQSL